MKPITNILLIAAIICYVFLPFRTMDLAGSITGLSYSAGLITENFSLLKTIFALLPFIACFAGVAINSNKHRYWGSHNRYRHCVFQQARFIFRDLGPEPRP